MSKQIFSRFPLPATPAKYELDTINRACTLAFVFHLNQYRKDDVTPQFLHCLAVQRLIARIGVTDPLIHAAALLHDCVEENHRRSDDVRTRILVDLGQDVLAMVDDLTDNMSSESPRHRRKAQQLARIARASKPVQLVKLADVVATAQEGPAPRWTPDQCRAYVRQRTELIEVLQSNSVELADLFEQSLRQPVWQDALSAE